MTRIKKQKRDYEKLRYGMVGGGEGAFIGEVHRKAIAMDGKAELVAGCFSRDFKNTKNTGEILGLDPSRLYPTYKDMFEKESQKDERIDFVVIVTPNNTHFPISEAAMEHGIHVVCDKPLTITSRDSERLAEISEKKDLLFCVTYTYTGYPMVKQMKTMIANGELGKIRFINAEYPQEWLSRSIEKEGQKLFKKRMKIAENFISNFHKENIFS